MAKGRLWKRAVRLGFFAAVAYAFWRWLQQRQSDSTLTWEPQPLPFPPRPRAPDPWIEPANGSCPTSHPVKAKLSSGIYHLTGGVNYERTTPDRCYLDPAAAERDGLRAAKR